MFNMLNNYKMDILYLIPNIVKINAWYVIML